MLLFVLAIAAGILILALSADQFVIGAARVAVLRAIPPMVIGVVIIGFGTSAPELLVSLLALLGDEPEVAIGNVVGSNLANLSLLLGVGALMVPITVASGTVRREAPIVVVAVVLFALALQGGAVTRLEGIGLLGVLALALHHITRRSPTPAGSDALSSDVVEFADAAQSRLKAEVTRTIAGLLGTIGAAQLLLWGATGVADDLGLTGGFVGATLVAVGTSLPELVTVIQSARRNETDLIVGNLLGSNLFNALGVGGLLGLVGSETVDAPELTVIAAGGGVIVALLAALAMRTAYVVSRREGAALVIAYLAVLPLLN